MSAKNYAYEVIIPYNHHFRVDSDEQLTRMQILKKAHAKEGTIAGWNDEEATVLGDVAPETETIDEQIEELQQEIADHYDNIENYLNRIRQLLVAKHTEAEAPIPFVIDERGIIHRKPEEPYNEFKVTVPQDVDARTLIDMIRTERPMGQVEVQPLEEKK